MTDQEDARPQGQEPRGDDEQRSDGHLPDPEDVDLDEVERERSERLDPDNRPENAEVDNTQRDFDAERGAFTDSPDYEQREPKFPAPGEQGA